jgi:hypothetical protein
MNSGTEPELVRAPSPNCLVSVVRRLQGLEIRRKGAGANLPDMATPDYLFYSIGLVLVTILVVVA